MVEVERVGRVSVVNFPRPRITGRARIRDICLRLDALVDGEEKWRLLLNVAGVASVPIRLAEAIVRLEQEGRSRNNGKTVVWGMTPRLEADFGGHEVAKHLRVRHAKTPDEAINEAFGNPLADLTIYTSRGAGDCDAGRLNERVIEGVIIRPEWRTGDVIAVAEQADATGDLGAAPVLADALQEAGCDDLTILTFLRSVGAPVRQRWAVELVLGTAVAK